MEIFKAVIPAAGLDTRFLPFTKVLPAEMLPLINKPAIQFSVEEALASAVSTFMIITNKNKEAIANHFDNTPWLEELLKERNYGELLAHTERIIRASNFMYIRQPEPLGLGHAVMMARHAIGKEYFGILLPDEIILSKQPALAQLIRIARQEKASVIAVQEVPTEAISSYGMVGIKKQITSSLFQISSLVEKPSAKDAPSNLAVIGRYVLSYKIFNSLEAISTYATENLELTDGISHMIQNNERVFAYKIQGTRYDIGTPLGWIKAIISYSLQDPEYSSAVKKFLSELQTVDSYLYNPAKTFDHNFEI